MGYTIFDENFLYVHLGSIQVDSLRVVRKEGEEEEQG